MHQFIKSPVGVLGVSKTILRLDGSLEGLTRLRKDVTVKGYKLKSAREESHGDGVKPRETRCKLPDVLPVESHG